MNAAVWRRGIAGRVAEVYAENPNVRAVVLAGSTARGLADSHSDVELEVFWANAPSEAERREPIERLAANVVGFWPLEDDEWSEAYTMGQLRFDLSSFLVTTMDQYLAAVVDQANTDEAKQFLVTHILHGLSLVDKDTRVGHWKRKAHAYPEGLSRAMVQRHLTPHRRWAQRHALVERDDSICVQELLLESAKALLAALCGLNRVYLSHPAFKWMDALVRQLSLAPVDLAARLRYVFRSPSAGAVSELQSLLLESCDLIARHLPGAGAEDARSLFCEARPSLPEHGPRETVPE